MSPITLGDVAIDFKVPYEDLMFRFRHTRVAIRKWGDGFGDRDPYFISVKLIPVGMECDGEETLSRVMIVALRNASCRPLWDFEALTLNWYRDDLQKETPFVGYRLAFGVPVSATHQGWHNINGNQELSTIKQYAQFGTPRHLMIAATPITNVDLDRFSGDILNLDIEASWQAYKNQK